LADFFDFEDLEVSCLLKFFSMMDKVRMI